MKHSSFDATISALDAEMSTIARRSFHATISALDAETSVLDAETSALGTETSALGVSAIARSYQRYRRGVSGDCGVGITPQTADVNQSY